MQHELEGWGMRKYETYEGKKCRHTENYIKVYLKELPHEVTGWHHWYMTGISGGLLLMGNIA